MNRNRVAAGKKRGEESSREILLPADKEKEIVILYATLGCHSSRAVWEPELRPAAPWIERRRWIHARDFPNELAVPLSSGPRSFLYPHAIEEPLSAHSNFLALERQFESDP